MIGIVTQVALIGTDAVADRLALPHISNPYRRTIGWHEFGEAAGRMARQAGAKTIASDSRSDFAALQYYWRDQPEKVVWWRSVELPTFALKEALTDSSPAPILFVTPCSSLDKVRKLYAEVAPLGLACGADRVVAAAPWRPGVLRIQARWSTRADPVVRRVLRGLGAQIAAALDVTGELTGLRNTAQ